MTEGEWLTATDPTPMLPVLLGKASERKLRLVMCGLFRVMYHPDDRRNAVVDIGELFTDGNASPDHLYWAKCFRLSNDGSDSLEVLTQAASANDVYEIIRYLYLSHPSHPDPKRLCLLIREIFGNPFRPVAFAPVWRTTTAFALARQMYEGRDFSVMPILADALQDAGCEDEAVLSHCRGEGPHCRGCWIVDLLLGKE